MAVIKTFTLQVSSYSIEANRAIVNFTMLEAERSGPDHTMLMHYTEAFESLEEAKTRYPLGGKVVVTLSHN